MLHVCCSAGITETWKLKGFDCLYQNIHPAVNLPLQIGTVMMHLFPHHNIPASHLAEIAIDFITPSNRMRNDTVSFLAIL